MYPTQWQCLDADIFETQVNSVLKNIFWKAGKRKMYVALTDNEVRLEKAGESASSSLISVKL